MQPHAGQPVEVSGSPLESAAGVVVMVHGRNAAPANILDLVPRLDRPQFAFVAPAAADRTWYPHSFLTEIAKNEPGLSSGLFVLDQLVANLAARGIPRNKVILLGFSQGACLASEFAVRYAQRYGGLVVFSGGLIGPQGTTWDYDGGFDGMPAYLGCSDVDAHIPKERVEESAGVLGRMGADVTLQLFPGMGHLVSDEEIARARVIMDGVG